MKKSFLILTIIPLFFLTSCSANHQKNIRTFTIGSGSKNAMYYPVATILCDTFNKYNQDKNIVCKAALSKGAQYNLDAVENGEFDMGIAQTNLQHDAYMGNKKFINNPHKNLRSVMSLHSEYLTIIAKKEANIENFSDLKNKKVNIGNPGSGSRILFLQMINELGWSLEDFKTVYNESGSDINKVLCGNDQAEAAIYIVGHPNDSFKNMIKNCNAKLVNLSDKEVATFISLSPNHFRKAFIPKKTYSEDQGKIKTFATFTVLTASKKLDDKIVKNFTKIILDHKKELVKKNPALSDIGIFQKTSNIAPLHESLVKIN